MSIKFKPQFDFESDDQNKPTRSIRSKPDNDLDFKSYQSMAMRKQAKQKDILSAKKIAINDFFADEDTIFGGASHSQIMVDQVKTQTAQSKTPGAKRKKVSTSIKLQPLQTLQLKKNVQKIQFINPSPPTLQLLKHQSSLIPPTQTPALEQQLQISKTLSLIYRSNLLNFEMNSSSEDEDEEKTEKGLDAFDVCLKREMGQSSSMLFFEEEDEKVGEKEEEKKEKKPELKQLKFKRTLKKRAESTNDAKQTSVTEESKKSQQIIFNQQPQEDNEHENSENQQREAKVGIQAEPNPQKKKQSPSQQQQAQLQNSQVQPVHHQKGVNFQTMKRMILSAIQKHSVLNLRLVRNKSILNFFSPEFRLEFFQDKYFVMGCKKTSSKPTSTFIFTCSQFNFEQTSKKYMGKMKSNIAGTVYNIFGPGFNPSNAKSYNLPPRQLLATVVYRTQIFGTGRPKQFSVYIKKPDLHYYRDFAGVRMYQDQIPLHQLYYNHPQNMGKIHVLNTRKPTYFKQTKEYVMNFEGKVKKSSIKNFIMEDRDVGNAKAMLFGKVNDDQYVLDVLGPMSPIVGVGVALTVFDTRLGSD